MIRLSALFLLLLLPLSGCQQSKLAYYRYFGPDYIYTDAAPLAAAFPAPPAPGSREERRDLEILLGWQEKRTPAECAAAQAQSFPDYGRFFGGVSPFPEPMPKEAERILFKVFYEGSKAVSVAKKRFGRPRPFSGGAGISPCISRPSSFSYPSGHAAVSRLMALALSEVQPEGRREFLARSDQAALNRVIGGVHYPSDIEAGKRFADLLFSRLSGDPAFREDLEKLRAMRAGK